MTRSNKTQADDAFQVQPDVICAKVADSRTPVTEQENAHPEGLPEITIPALTSQCSRRVRRVPLARYTGSRVTLLDHEVNSHQPFFAAEIHLPV
jgi:hypothetical protein